MLYSDWFSNEWTNWTIGIDWASKKENMETKLYPHKFFVQFHRMPFDVHTAEWVKEVENGVIVGHPKTLIYRTITSCVINPIDTVEWYYGMTVCNPKDQDNIMRGCKEAFANAIYDYATSGTGNASIYSNSYLDKLFFDALLKKNLTEENILTGFVLKVKLPWEKKNGH